MDPDRRLRASAGLLRLDDDPDSIPCRVAAGKVPIVGRSGGNRYVEMEMVVDILLVSWFG